MYVKFTKQSSGVENLVDYLSKEDDLLEKQRAKLLKSKNQEIKQCVEYLSKEIDNEGSEDRFFTNEFDNVEGEQVKFKIEHNCKGLKLDENRFFMANINPSKDEIEHIKQGVDLFCRENNITLESEKEALIRQHIKEFSNDVMDQYAQNFGREGVESAQDLVWYGKVEKYRYWKHDSKEVIENNQIFKQISVLEKKGTAQDIVNELRGQLHKDQDRVIYSNMPKSGENYHVHIIISRNDVEQKRKLSPLSKAQNSENHIVNGTKCKAGFNRVEFAKRVESVFDKRFDYVRPYEQTIDARLQFTKIRKEKTLINKSVAKLHLVDLSQKSNLSVQNHTISPEIRVIAGLESKKERLIRSTRVAAINYDTKNMVWERTNPHTVKPFFKTMDGFVVGDKVRVAKKQFTKAHLRNGLRVLPLYQNDNFGVKQYGKLDQTVMKSYTQVLLVKDKFALENIKYNVENKIWERQNPTTPRPYYMTEKGQMQIIEMRQGARQGVEVTSLKADYYKDRGIYNALNGIKNETQFKVHSNNNLVPRATNYISLAGKAAGNNLFRELHFNDVSKVVQISFSLVKAIHKTQKLKQMEAHIKDKHLQKNSITRHVVQKNKTVDVVMQNPINKATNNIKMGVQISHNYAQQAAMRAGSKIGRGLATQAMECVNPVLAPVKIISLATNFLSSFISNDLER